MIDDFATLLRNLRMAAGLTRAQLTANLSFGPSELSRWERGIDLPNAAEIAEIGGTLRLSSVERDRLYATAGFPTQNLNPSAPVPAEEVLQQENSSDPAIRDLQVQVDDLHDALESLLAKIERDKSPRTPPSIDELSEVRQLVNDVQATSRDLTAPIELPSNDEMKVRLISASLASSVIERLDEYRTESQKWSSWAGVFIGGAFGLLGNLVTGAKFSQEVWILLSILLFIGGLLTVSSVNKNKKAHEVSLQLHRPSDLRQ
jgi:transcriptional regulator with XRE-family HTH domain